MSCRHASCCFSVSVRDTSLPSSSTRLISTRSTSRQLPSFDVVLRTPVTDFCGRLHRRTVPVQPNCSGLVTNLLVVPPLKIVGIHFDGQCAAGSLAGNERRRLTAHGLRTVARDARGLFRPGHRLAGHRPGAVGRNDAAVPPLRIDPLRPKTDRRRVDELVVGPHGLDGVERERIAQSRESGGPSGIGARPLTFDRRGCRRTARHRSRAFRAASP